MDCLHRTGEDGVGETEGVRGVGRRRCADVGTKADFSPKDSGGASTFPVMLLTICRTSFLGCGDGWQKFGGSGDNDGVNDS